MASSSRLHVLGLAILAVGIVLRLVYLDADPDYYEWVGYVTDEGRWVAHAREIALYGQLSYDWWLHLHLAPLFQAMEYLVFLLGGVSIWTARILTAIAGSVLLIAFWWVFRGLATVHALVLGTALLALETDLVVMSRVAIPEMMAMLLEFCVFVALVAQPSRVWRSALAGVVLLVALGTKATIAPMVPVFCLVCLLLPREPHERRLAHAAAFVAALAIPAALIGLVGVVASRGSLAVLSKTTETVKAFVLGATAFNFLGFFFESTLSPLFAVWGLALWIPLLGFLAASRNAVARDATERQSRRVLASALIWIASYGVIMLALEYFPSRYKIHILVPMAVAITLALSLFQRAGLDAAVATHRLPGVRSWTFSAGVALPTAVLLAPLLADGLGVVRAGGVAVRVRIALVAVSMIVIALVVHRVRHVPGTATMAMLWPVLGMGAWTLGRHIGLTDVNFWPTGDVTVHAIAWTTTLIVTAPIAVLAAMLLRRAPAQAIGRATIAAAVCYTVVAAIRLGPAFASPSYTIREASRELAADLAGMPLVIAMNSEGLFNENQVRYHSLRRAGDEAPPGPWVTMFPLPRTVARNLPREHCPVKTYPVFVSKAYLREHTEHKPEDVRQATLWLPRSSGRCPAVAVPTEQQPSASQR